MTSFFRRRYLILPMLLAVVLLGCKPAGESGTGERQSKTGGDSSSVMVDSVNYMHERGVKYTIYDLSQAPPKAIGGAIVEMLATGGEKGCCLTLPKVWQPGIKVRVEWDEADRTQTFPEKYTQDLEVPRYETPADLFVVFYPQHEVELVVSAAEPGHPDWRGRIKKTPWEQCVETNGRKLCKAALPKLFDTSSYQGFCPEAIQEKWDNAERNCEVMMERCMKDYEDESFCRGILWGARKK